MTVCVGALANDGLIICCIADKALSWGDHIQWETDVTKIIPWRSSKGVFMVSGSEYGDRVLGKFLRLQDFGEDRQRTIAAMERAYQETYDEIVDIKFFKQNAITRQEYISATGGPGINEHFKSIADGIRQFSLGADILACGFDANGQAFLLLVESPGHVVDLTRAGFHAIGSGFDHAIARLLFMEYARSHLSPRVLYECFDAKAHAEMAAGVGREWDGYLVVPEGAVPVPQEIKPIIDQVWAMHNRSPYHEASSDDEPEPPADWRGQMARIFGALFESLGIPVLPAPGQPLQGRLVQEP